MTYVTLEEFLAEIENTFQNYADTNDIDRISVKGWVIDKLRMFGKNICDTRELIAGVENSRALLPENFKSLQMALKLEGDIYDRGEKYREVPYKKYVTHDVQWDSASQSYVKDACQSQQIIESLIKENNNFDRYMDVVPLSLIKGIQKSTLDADCYNLHPSIRDNYPNKISITNRTLQANFKKGLVYLIYNSLPEQDGEIAIPIISTNDIVNYITNSVKIKIAENLIINAKNPSAGLQNLMSLWLQQDRLLFVRAQSEANWYGLGDDFAKKMYQKKNGKSISF